MRYWNSLQVTSWKQQKAAMLFTRWESRGCPISYACPAPWRDCQGFAGNEISWACEITPWRDFTLSALDLPDERDLSRGILDFCTVRVHPLFQIDNECSLILFVRRSMFDVRLLLSADYTDYHRLKNKGALVRGAHHSIKLWTFSPFAFSPWFSPRMGALAPQSMDF